MIQTLAALDMDAVIYQVTGMCVVICCLSFLSVILTVSGAVAQRLDAKRKAQAEAAKAAMAPAPAAAPVVAPELPPALPASRNWWPSTRRHSPTPMPPPLPIR